MAKEMIAMLLAGGQGSRLYALTQKLAKPAVPFGGKYRIIDFPLSNCVNSGIDTVGILTQYQPMVLNEYIGNGQPWDLDRLYGGVHVLPPYQKASGSDWYKGTANAIYQNLSFTQAPFSNITLDWTVPNDLANLPAIVGGKEQDFTYGDCKEEMDMINRAFIETMIEGDAQGRGFQYPIPTYSITKDFDWSCRKNPPARFSSCG